MKSILKYLLGAIIIVFLFDNIIYHKITHLDKTDMQWVNNRNIWDSAVFVSDNGDMDTLLINCFELQNSMCPFKFNPNVQELIAFADIQYIVRHDNNNITGIFRISKAHIFQPPLIDIYLDGRGTSDLKCTLKSVKLYKGTLNDCIVLDDQNSHVSKNEMFKYDITSFVWSKSLGLVQFSFKDGATYTLADLR